jgi:hypothetical protein
MPANLFAGTRPAGGGRVQLTVPVTIAAVLPAAKAEERASPAGGESRRHLRVGWWSVLGFGAFVLVLEILHGMKAGFYLDVSNDTRRLMWTLAHAHGTLLGLVHIAFAVSLPWLPALGAAGRRAASRSLIAATILLPGGFFLGGVRFYAGDPGVGIALVPVGAMALLVGAWVVAAGAGRSS